MQKIISNKKFKFCLIFFLSQLMGIRFFLNSSYISFNPYFMYGLYVLISFVIFYIFIKSDIINIFLIKNLFYIIIFVSLVLLYFQYPIQDNLKIYNLGSDQDDCFMIIINNIINNNKIYSNTYLGNPCSTGMAEFLFYFPVIFYKNFFFIIPILSLLMCFYVFKDLLNYRDSILIFYIQISNLVFIELSSAGSDFMLIGAAYLLGTYLLKKSIDTKNKYYLIISFLLLFFFYGSRSIFLFLIPLNFILFFYYNPLKIKTFFIILFSISSLSYIIPWIISYPNFFPPFHLFSKGIYFILSVKLATSIIIILFLIFCMLLFKKIKFNQLNKKYFYYLNYLVLIIPLLYISLSRVFVIDNLAKWEALNYFMIFLPSLYYLILSIENTYIKK
mgnify:CR=1 FL=1